MTSTPLDRFKHVLATICLEHPDMKLEQALLLADEIEQRMDEMPLGTLTSATVDGMTDPEDWVKYNKARLSAMNKLDAIKDIRAHTSLGLKEAKELCERMISSHATSLWGSARIFPASTT